MSRVGMLRVRDGFVIGIDSFVCVFFRVGEEGLFYKYWFMMIL